MAGRLEESAVSDFIFMILMDVPEEIEDKFNSLYDTDHLPLMMQVPGNRRCDRYRLDWSDNPDMLKYLALYEIDNPDLPRSADWKGQAGQGRWPSEIRALIRARRNGVFRRIAAHNGGDESGNTGGGREHLYFLQQGVPAAIEERFNMLYDTDHVPLMLQVPGVHGCNRFRLEWSDSGDVPDYLALYDVDGPEIPKSATWKEQTNKGAWPVEMRPNFTARRNGAFSRIFQITSA